MKEKLQFEALGSFNSTPLDISKIFERPLISFSDLIRGKMKVHNYYTILLTMETVENICT